MKLNTRTIVAIGIGAAIYYVLSAFVKIPSGIPNTDIRPGPAFLSMMAVIFGPIAGAIIGLIGHTLTDIYPGGGMIWWSWVAASVFFGFVVGLCWKKINIDGGDFSQKKMLIYNIYQLAANAIGYGVIAPILDIIIYKEPVSKAFSQGIVAGVANFVTVAILGTIFLGLYAKTRTKSGSLSRE